MSNRASQGRPATVFLSYRRDDKHEVVPLQQQLQARGIKAQRDETDIPVGLSHRDEIERIIQQESDAFLLYATQGSLTSDYIWPIEIPAALIRQSNDPTFSIIPVLRNISTDELSSVCEQHNVKDLIEFNALSLSAPANSPREQVRDEISKIARRVLTDTLRLRFRRLSQDIRTYEPSLCLHTDNYASSWTQLDLDLDWQAFFDDGYPRIWPNEPIWQETLLPALKEVRDALNPFPHTHFLHLDVHARLPEAFALGFTFSRTTRFNFAVSDGRFICRTNDTVADDENPLNAAAEDTSGEKHIATVEVSVSQRITRGVTNYLAAQAAQPGYRAQFEVKGGAGQYSVKDNAHILAMARQLGQEIRNLHSDKGITQFHLFLSGPASLAVLLGHQLNAVGIIIIYHYINSTGEYRPGCVVK